MSDAVLYEVRRDAAGSRSTSRSDGNASAGHWWRVRTHLATGSPIRRFGPWCSRATGPRSAPG